MNSGRDVAGLRGAVAGVHAASFGLDSQLSDTLSGVLQAYADLYEAEVDAANEAAATEVGHENPVDNAVRAAVVQQRVGIRQPELFR